MNDDQKELDALRAFFDVSEKHMPSGAINDAPEDFQAAHAAVLATRHPGVGYSKDLRAGLPQDVPPQGPKTADAQATQASEMQKAAVAFVDRPAADVIADVAQEGHAGFLQATREAEVAGKNRSTVIAAVDAQLAKPLDPPAAK